MLKMSHVAPLFWSFLVINVRPTARCPFHGVPQVQFAPTDGAERNVLLPLVCPRQTQTAGKLRKMFTTAGAVVQVNGVKAEFNEHPTPF